MSRASVTARGRRRAEAGLADTCRVTRPSDTPRQLNHATGEYDSPEPVTVYEGPCRIQDLDTSPQSPEVAEATWTTQGKQLQLPVVGTEDIAEDQTVTVLTAAHDQALAGRVFRVKGLHHATHKTTRRLWVEEITGA